jgi:hypothetical protein
LGFVGRAVSAVKTSVFQPLLWLPFRGPESAPVLLLKWYSRQILRYAFLLSSEIFHGARGFSQILSAGWRWPPLQDYSSLPWKPSVPTTITGFSTFISSTLTMRIKSFMH